MTPLAQEAARIVFTGTVATAAMDGWLLLLATLGMAKLDYTLLGRWVGHLAHGRWAHAAIAKAPAVRGERALGWLAHYAIGVVFAAVLIASTPRPSLLQCLAFGIATVALPLFVMQPAMGAGIASRNTPTPLRNCLRSLANHTVFGAGLYLAAGSVALVSPGVQ